MDEENKVEEVPEVESTDTAVEEPTEGTTEGDESVSDTAEEADAVAED